MVHKGGFARQVERGVVRVTVLVGRLEGRLVHRNVVCWRSSEQLVSTLASTTQLTNYTVVPLVKPKLAILLCDQDIPRVEAPRGTHEGGEHVVRCKDCRLLCSLHLQKQEQ